MKLKVETRNTFFFFFYCYGDFYLLACSYVCIAYVCVCYGICYATADDGVANYVCLLLFLWL